MTCSHVKVQGKWSIGSKNRVEIKGQTDQRTEMIALPVALMRSIMTIARRGLKVKVMDQISAVIK